MISSPAIIRAGLLLAFGLAVTACGSDDAGGTGGGGGSAPDAGDQDVQQADAPGEDADQPDVNQEAGACTDVTSVSGSVIDESDNAFSGADVVLCITQEGGKSLCLSPKKTNASGEFTVSMKDGNACLVEAAYQVKSFADVSLVPSYCPVELGAGGEVTVPDPVKLVQAPACTRDALGDVTQPHVVTSSGGATMTVVPDGLWLLDSTYEDLRVVTWDETQWGWPCFIDASNPPDGLVAFAPEIEVKSEGGLQVSFPNDAGLAAGTVVDLYALGNGVASMWDDTPVHEGHWDIIGEAEVTSDGSRIETTGQGLPFGTWVGWKQK